MVDQDLKLMKDSLVQDNVLNQAKTLLIREIPLSEGSQKSIASGLLKRSLDDLPLDEPVLAAKKYLKINSNDIKKAFTTWIHPENLAQIIEGPQPPQQ
jgi:zinc protease